MAREKFQHLEKATLTPEAIEDLITEVVVRRKPKNCVLCVFLFEYCFIYLDNICVSILFIYFVYLCMYLRTCAHMNPHLIYLT